MEEDEPAAVREKGQLNRQVLNLIQGRAKVRLLQPFAVWGGDKGHLADCCGEMKA